MLIMVISLFVTRLYCGSGACVNGAFRAAADKYGRMNPYEIVRDAVLIQSGMGVKPFVILVLAMTVVFTLLI